MTQSIFAKRLRIALEQSNLKQIDVVRMASEQGEKLGKSQLSQYLNGKTFPREDKLNLLAEIVGTSPAWLAGSEPSSDTHHSLSYNEMLSSVNPKAKPQSTVSLPTKKEKEFEKVVPEPAGIPSEKLDSIDFKEPETDTKRRVFKKSKKLDDVLYDVRGPVVDEANRMEAIGTHVLKLNIGNPAPFGFRTPDEVVYDMSRQLKDCEGYSASKGLFSARKAIMQYAQIKGIPNVTMDDIYTGNGVSELINICMSALLDSGDEILIPAPDYPLWTACATLAGGTPVHYLCDEQAEWYPDLDDIKKKITSNTKAIVIINPNNPTGALYSQALLQEIVEIAREHQLIIFSDEIYDRLVINDEGHVSIASLAPDLFCVTFNGLSKSHMIAGYRIGWMILSGNKNSARDYILGLNMLSNMRLCSNVPAQSIVQTALGGHQSVKGYIVPGGRIYEQHKFTCNALENIPGISLVKPKAAFYAFPKLDVKKFNITDDEKFALDLLRDKKVLVVHGRGFNWEQPDHFRIVYLPRVEILDEALTKLADFLSYYRQ